ncbi:hypothetical protein NL676_013299 [Syzygium grande]|nr:hypothetical protein NL676_013299 [Syzygium grande]
MAEKKVAMEISVDLKCYRCVKKIKKVICKFPWKLSSFIGVIDLGTREIQNQVFNEKDNKVLITVVSCCPERIRDKIARKGGKTVESIKIVLEKKEPEKKKEGEKPKEEEKKKGRDKSKEGEKKKDAPAAEKSKEGEKKKEEGGGGGGGDKPKGGEKKEAQVHKHIVDPVSGYPMIYPSGMYYQLPQPPQPYYQGYGAVPYYHGVPAYYGEGGYGVNRGYNTNHSGYFSEENPELCTVM